MIYRACDCAKRIAWPNTGEYLVIYPQVIVPNFYTLRLLRYVFFKNLMQNECIVIATKDGIFFFP